MSESPFQRPFLLLAPGFVFQCLGFKVPSGSHLDCRSRGREQPLLSPPLACRARSSDGFSHQAHTLSVSKGYARGRFSEQPTQGSPLCLWHALPHGWFLKGPCWPIFQDEPVQWETPDLSQAEIEQKIKEYNGQINSNLFMSLVS